VAEAGSSEMTDTFPSQVVPSWRGVQVDSSHSRIAGIHKFTRCYEHSEMELERRNTDRHNKNIRTILS
jgi:hypothetical protein